MLTGEIVLDSGGGRVDRGLSYFLFASVLDGTTLLTSLAG